MKIDLKGKRIEVMPAKNRRVYKYMVNAGFNYWYFDSINDCYHFVNEHFENYLLRVTDILGVVDEENHLKNPKKFDIRDIFDSIFGGYK